MDLCFNVTIYNQLAKQKRRCTSKEDSQKGGTGHPRLRIDGIAILNYFCCDLAKSRFCFKVLLLGNNLRPSLNFVIEASILSASRRRRAISL